MIKGWLVNDRLTCIPNTRTLWHDLLDSLPNLEDKTFNYTPFHILPDKIELELKKLSYEEQPDYIIRNGTFFRPINLPYPNRTKVISLIQDIYSGAVKNLQERVIQSSNLVVFNSLYTKSLYNTGTIPYKIIPLGSNDRLFKPDKKRIKSENKTLPNSILFIGSSTNFPKGFDLLMKIINNTQWNYTLVMKDDFQTDLLNVKVFNKITQERLQQIMKQCVLGLGTSKVETQWLSGIEMNLMNIPVFTNNVGIYYNDKILKDRKDYFHEYGINFSDASNSLNNFIREINEFMRKSENGMNYNFSPRKWVLNKGLTTEKCMQTWNKCIEEIIL